MGSPDAEAQEHGKNVLGNVLTQVGIFPSDSYYILGVPYFGSAISTI